MSVQGRRGERPGADRRRSTAPAAERSATDYVAGYASAVAKIGGALFVLCTIYFIYAVYGGYLDQGVDPDKARTFALIAKLLILSAGLGTAGLAIWTLDEIGYTIGAGIVGALILFGHPMLILSRLRDPASPIAREIATGFMAAGIACLAVVVLRVIWYVAEVIRTGPQSRQRALEEEEAGLSPKRVKRSRGMWSKCWDLPYCHDTIKELCPAFQARRNCWRFGRGCNCDPSLIEAMIRSGAARVGKGQDKTGAAVQRTQDEYLRDLLGAKQKGTPEGRTISCAKCPIYGEHQRQKFQIANPVVLVASLLGLAAAYPVLIRVYGAAVKGLAALASTLVLGQDITVAEWIERLNTPTVRSSSS